VLRTQGLTKRYGEVLALLDMDLHLEAGGCLVLLGRNGAGKSTALRCMAGIVAPTSGRAWVDGIEVTAEPDRVRARIGLMPELPGLYERMSARAYLDYFGQIYRIDVSERRRRIESLLGLFDLAAAGDRWLGSYSKGMRQKVALIRSTLHRPALVLADEPTSALDPASARLAWEYLKGLQAAGSALVVCTHSMVEAEELAGTVGIMSAARLLATGDLASLTRRSGLKPRREVRRWPGLQEIYLSIVGEPLEEAAASA
jgi:ABC-2 type transport system ATP-binding protein